MKKIALAFAVIILVGAGLFAAYRLGFNNKSADTSSVITVAPTENIVGGDRDEYGCIPSAGYSWCEAKQKCLREWEEPCVDETESLMRVVKQALVAEHGPDAQSLEISASEISGNYAKGGAKEAVGGGGLWFAAKVNGVWELVWDGNGVITCSSLDSYPDFPSSMISQCYDEATQNMVNR